MDVKLGATVEVSLPQLLFPTQNIRQGGLPGMFEVASNGDRLLINELVDSSTSAPITVVTNWTAALKK